MSAEGDQSKERKASAVEETAEDLYENAPCGYVTTRPDGTIIKINKTLLSWLGYEAAAVVHQRRFQDLLSVGSQIFYETHVSPLLRMQSFTNEINLDLKTSSRQFIPVLMNTIQYKDADGHPQLYRSTLFNITDRKKYEKELLLARKKAEQAARAKADFLSMMSHEIRTPMNAIIGVAHLLEDTRLSTEQLDYVRLLKFSSEHLLQLINDILDFNKIEAGKATVEEKSTDIRQLISSAAYALKRKADEKNLALRIDIHEDVPAYVLLDPLKITQIMTNLISNAIKFTAHGGVTVRVTASDVSQGAATIHCAVTDSGIGIAKERLPEIFKEFTQASYEIGMKYGGSGLGLAICQKLLALYNTQMSVDSVAGKGSTFSFSLKLRLGTKVDQPQPVSWQSLNHDTLRGLRVLIAEDNPGNVYVLSRYLKKWGIEFDAVGNGDEALGKVQSRTYDLVLMDLQMPGMSGYEATRRIRDMADARYRELPIIALSASTRFGSEHEMETSGFHDFVGKPFRPEELFQKISFYCRRTPSSDEPPLALPILSGATDPATSAGAFSLDAYLEAIDFDTEAFLELAPITIESYTAAQHEFQEALMKGDAKYLDFHAHKLAMTMELLNANGLRDAIKEGKAWIESKDRDSGRLLQAQRRIAREIEAIVDALRKEVEARQSEGDQ